jgi:hypothetical protein
MTKVWYCPNCGYEVGSRGRCHSCHERLVPSSLPPLRKGREEDEVGYRLEGWSDRERGQLIELLNDLEILHRFEEDELVVDAADETRVDDLLAELQEAHAAGTDQAPAAAGNVEPAGGGAGAGSAGVPAEPHAAGAPAPSAALHEAGPAIAAAGSAALHEAGPADAPAELPGTLALLAAGARRLSADPTDMQADADVAEASPAVFMSPKPPSIDTETWAAIGRVTRRLLSALGADEALEDDIRSSAEILVALLSPRPPAGNGLEDGIVYELPEWLPEQRAELGLLLQRKGVAFEWDGNDLIVPPDREQEVEVLFAKVQGIEAPGEDDDNYDGDDEARYRALEELFASASRLASDPGDEERAAELLDSVEGALGPAPIGVGEVEWLQITGKARLLAELIRDDAGPQALRSGAVELRELLRQVV